MFLCFKKSLKNNADTPNVLFPQCQNIAETILTRAAYAVKV